MRSILFALCFSSYAFAGMAITDANGFATGYTDTIPANADINGVPTPITCDVAFSFGQVNSPNDVDDTVLSLTCDVAGTEFSFYHDVDALGHATRQGWDILGAGDGPVVGWAEFAIDYLNFTPGDIRSTVPMTGGGQSLEPVRTAFAEVTSDYDDDNGGIQGTYSGRTIFDFQGPGSVSRINASHSGSVSAVPEPSSFLMLSLVATMIAGVRRYYRRGK